MGYTDFLQKAIDYIEDNIHSPITVEQCADMAGFSKYHFYRLFVVYVGVPVMEFVRRRRLAHAMFDVTCGKRILDIALDYGYSSERAFSRAFIQEFGKAPTAFRKITYAIPRKTDLRLMELRLGAQDICGSTSGGASLEPSLAPTCNSNATAGCGHLGGSMTMEYLSDVRLEELKTMHVASASVASKEPEEDVITYMCEWRRKNGVDPRNRSFGFDIAVSEEESAQGLRGYEYWVVVPENTKITDDKVTLKKIEGGRYAVLRITDPFVDPFTRIPQGWRKLVDWVKDRENITLTRRRGYCLEEKIEENGTADMDLFLAIE